MSTSTKYPIDICPALLTGEETLLQASTRNRTVDTLVRFTCSNPDYHLSGPDILHCQNSGLWNGTKPDCITELMTSTLPVNGTDVMITEAWRIETVIIILWVSGGVLLVTLLILLACILMTQKKGRQPRGSRTNIFHIDAGGSNPRSGGDNPAFSRHEEIWTWIPVVRGNQTGCTSAENNSTQNYNTALRSNTDQQLRPPPYSVAVGSSPVIQSPSQHRTATINRDTRSRNDGIEITSGCRSTYARQTVVTTEPSHNQPAEQTTETDDDVANHIYESIRSRHSEPDDSRRSNENPQSNEQRDLCEVVERAIRDREAHSRLSQRREIRLPRFRRTESYKMNRSSNRDELADQESARSEQNQTNFHSIDPQPSTSRTDPSLHPGSERLELRQPAFQPIESSQPTTSGHGAVRLVSFQPSDDGAFTYYPGGHGRRIWCDVPPSLFDEDGPPPYNTALDGQRRNRYYYRARSSAPLARMDHEQFRL